eukprot:861518-Pleurochrysis_carterae.AAC.5
MGARPSAEQDEFVPGLPRNLSIIQLMLDDLQSARAHAALRHPLHAYFASLNKTPVLHCTQQFSLSATSSCDGRRCPVSHLRVARSVSVEQWQFTPC